MVELARETGFSRDDCELGASGDMETACSVFLGGLIGHIYVMAPSRHASRRRLRSADLLLVGVGGAGSGRRRAGAFGPPALQRDNARRGGRAFIPCGCRLSVGILELGGPALEVFTLASRARLCRRSLYC